MTHANDLIYPFLHSCLVQAGIAPKADVDDRLSCSPRVRASISIPKQGAPIVVEIDEKGPTGLWILRAGWRCTMGSGVGWLVALGRFVRWVRALFTLRLYKQREMEPKAYFARNPALRRPFRALSLMVESHTRGVAPG